MQRAKGAKIKKRKQRSVGSKPEAKIEGSKPEAKIEGSKDL
jgi:hypothetical protein